MHGKPFHRQPHQTGAGHSAEEEESDSDLDESDAAEWMGIESEGERNKINKRNKIDDLNEWKGIDNSDEGK